MVFLTWSCSSLDSISMVLHPRERGCIFSRISSTTPKSTPSSYPRSVCVASQPQGLGDAGWHRAVSWCLLKEHSCWFSSPCVWVAEEADLRWMYYAESLKSFCLTKVLPHLFLGCRNCKWYFLYKREKVYHLREQSGHLNDTLFMEVRVAVGCVGAELVSAWLGGGFPLQLEAVWNNQIRIDPEPPKHEIYP